MYRKFLYLVLTLFHATAFSTEYRMQQGDTLWSLSSKYLENPRRWIEITAIDGSPIGNPKKIPIGKMVVIPDGISNQVAITSKSTKPPQKVMISNPSLTQMMAPRPIKVGRLTDYELTQKEGLVRAFYDGQEVVIDVAILIAEMKKSRGHAQ